MPDKQPLPRRIRGQAQHPADLIAIAFGWPSAAPPVTQDGKPIPELSRKVLDARVDHQGERAAGCGTWLCGAPIPVVPRISHVTPQKRDVTYDHRAQQAAIAVDAHYADDAAVETLLVLTPSQVELIRIQLDQAIEKRLEART
jgi:hypothetical protein